MINKGVKFVDKNSVVQTAISSGDHKRVLYLIEHGH
jgi:hypothetical protein